MSVGQGSMLLELDDMGGEFLTFLVMGHFGDNGVEESDLCYYQMYSVFVRSDL